MLSTLVCHAGAVVCTSGYSRVTALLTEFCRCNICVHPAPKSVFETVYICVPIAPQDGACDRGTMSTSAVNDDGGIKIGRPLVLLFHGCQKKLPASAAQVAFWNFIQENGFERKAGHERDKLIQIADEDKWAA